MLGRVSFVFLVSSCVGGALALTSGLLGPEKNFCPGLSSVDLDACLISDPCCFVTPRFENGCFLGCDPVCHNSAFCDRKCPVLKRYEVESCVNTDGLCFVQELKEDIFGQTCFRGCVKGCA
ncbi:uncharacterized protein LOC111111325 [Crassostrea virginica]|uniref:Uncharacterized protein LOC111111325 n=1 Tax=Crassostrea virginica TaxID=6565 RepID=A0A8B8E985_CRAVI|nr:uncharacterized protein LOC111111325 [Crassostrea virginica]XP_022336224.1 uncharacterized protein LOC111132686 [Crassostrea virginica]